MASKLSRHLQREMEERGLTYREFADELDVPVSQLHNWTNGNTEPHLKTLRMLAKKLRRSVADLIEAA